MNELMISVIIPVYNAEKYLDECLVSVEKQTYRNFECIMIDDGSTDGSAEIAKSYALRDSRFRYFYQDNAGVSAARNQGLDKAKGRYVTFLDADDSLEDTYFQEYMNCFQETKADIVCGGYIQKGNKYLNFIDRENGLPHFLENILTGSGGVVWGKFFLSKLLRNHNFRENVSMREDLIFLLELCKKLPGDVYVEYLENYGYLYRAAPGGLSSAKRPLDCTVDCSTEIVDLMLALGTSPEVVSNFIKSIVLWDCVACARNQESIAAVTDSLLMRKHGNCMTIKTMRDFILFAAVKKKNAALANMIYRVYAPRLGGKR